MSDLQTHAVLDSAHIGDIRGAFGTIKLDDHGPRFGLWARLKTLFAILGPGLIVMVGDNDAGAFSTYAQAGQNHGTALLWTLALLIPVLYVNQEMVLRLGAVTGVGHARLILERFGKFWGAFSVIDLFILNALTIVTEFIGISLGLEYLGLPKVLGICVAALLIMLTAGTGDFRRFERFSLILVAGSFLLIPVFIMVHPPISAVVHDFIIPRMPTNAPLADVMILIIGIVGTTVAPWQLFFQQSYVIDKRITPRFIRYERIDLWMGIIVVIVGAVAIMASMAHLFEGTVEAGKFVDAGTVAAGLEKYYGRLPGVLFAIALIDASIIGASAISLSTAYALGDLLSMKHSLHRKPGEAKGFYAVFCGLIVISGALVAIPGVPLGLLTNAVQTLAGILLPSAAVFLLLLCNDKQVLGPWVNGRFTNFMTVIIVAILVILSIVLTTAVVFPDISAERILQIMAGGCILALILGLAGMTLQAHREASVKTPQDWDIKPTRKQLDSWRMPPLDTLQPNVMTTSTRIWMGLLRGYLLVAVLMVIYKIVQMAL
ncbi:NRAMP (natural resistance-associated macrophage protein)-like metal ion transporter [Oxalobacteraceae bacterium GrIS 2.11]